MAVLNLVHLHGVRVCKSGRVKEQSLRPMRMVQSEQLLLVFGQQYDQAEDEPQNQEVRGHQEEGHRVKVASGSLQQSRAPELFGRGVAHI